MRRLLNFVLLALMIAGAAFTFEVKHQAEQASADIVKLKRQIAFESETIELLKAEVSVLSQPAVLQELTERHADQLQLQPLTVDQVITLRELPETPTARPRAQSEIFSPRYVRELSPSLN